MTKLSCISLLSLFANWVQASESSNNSDHALLEVLLKNGVISQTQFKSLSNKTDTPLGSNALLDILTQNGAITKEQAKALSIPKEPVRLVNAPPAAKHAASETNTEKPNTTKVSMGEDGFKVESPDGAFKATMGGRLQLDSQVNWDQKGHEKNIYTTGLYPLSDGVDFRRARLYVEGTYYEDWEYRFEYDFTRGSAATGITDAFLKATLFEPIVLTFGQYKEPISLESVTSNRFLTFIERSLPNNAFIEFANPYMVGFQADTIGDLWNMPYTLRTSFQTEPTGGGNPNASTLAGGSSNRNGYVGNTGFGPIGRFTFLPWSNGSDVVHVGVNGAYREPNNNFSEADGSFRNGGFSFASQIDSNVDRSALFNTQNLTTADGSRVINHFTRFNPEMAVVYGPFSVQGEYFRTQISGRGYDSSDVLTGAYAFASFFLTGESRNYDKKRGAFARLTPFQKFDLNADGGWGAWEVAARWDYLNMNTSHIHGGTGDIGTAALNWYINPRVRFMLDYVHVFDYRQDLQSSLYALNALHNDILETRIQIDW